MPTVAGAGSIVVKKFTTRAFATGIPTVLAGSPVVSIYKDASLTQSVTGVTLTVNFDGVVGLNHVDIDTSTDGTFYSNESRFYLVITTGTVGGTSVVGEVVGDFDLAAPIGPTTGGVNVVQILGTASQGAAGYVGIDWAHVTNPTTTVGLSGTTISTGQTIATVTNQLSASAIEGAVWNADLSTHLGLGTTGEALNNAESSDPWATLLPGAYAVGTAGEILGNSPAVTDVVEAVLTTQMTEDYNVDGVAPTLAQAQFLIMQRLIEFSTSGTVITVKKLDGSTTAYSLTLDSATFPTAIERTS